MNQPIKNILIVFGTRPEVIKLAPLILALKDSPLKHRFITVSTSQHEELLDDQLNYWNIVPDYFLTPSPHKGNLTRLLSHTLSGLQDIIEQLSTIEYVIVQGDTNTALAASNLAFLNQLKLIHIEAGLRSFDYKNPFPEEYNRTLTSKAAYFHFAPTEASKNNLLKEGIDASKIMVTGNTGIDALYLSKQKGPVSDNPGKIMITLHRRENIDRNYLVLTEAIHELAGLFPDLTFTWITHPNCSDLIRSNMQASANIEVLEHLPYNEFINLYASAKIVITDSGGVTEEAIQLGLPVIVFRQTTERNEAISGQYPMIVSLKKTEIISFFKDHINKRNDRSFSYGEGNASRKIVNWLISETNYDTVIIGGGPAGTGLLLKALKDGDDHPFFNGRIALIESSSRLVKGNITQYQVNSDTFSDVFLECLEGATGNFIGLDQLKAETDLIRTRQGRSIPLKELDHYFSKLGDLLQSALTAAGKCEFMMNSSVNKITRKTNGTYEVFISGQTTSITAKQVIIATGGVPKTIEEPLFSSHLSLHNFRDKTIHSDTLLRSGLPGSLKIALSKDPRVVILGGSHSAFSAAHFLLNSAGPHIFAPGSIKIWCNALPKIYFSNKEDAEASGYSDFTDEDICPVTKKIYRLAGLRMDGRELYMRTLGMGYPEKETRVNVTRFKNHEDELNEDLQNATLIITAFGYKLNIVPFFNEDGTAIRLRGEHTNSWVNDHCQLLDEDGSVVPNVFASGLATGFIPKGELGGEASFRGQTNGIWYYQNAIAGRIINNLNKGLSPVYLQK